MAITKICFFGASTTEGLGDEARLGWPGRLLADTAAGRNDIAGYNLGVGGQTTSILKARFMAECQTRLSADARKVIFLSFGLNDVAEVGGIPRMPHHRTLKNVEEIICQATDIADVILWMGAAPIHDEMMPITYENGNVFSFSNQVISTLNDEYYDIATKYKIPYLDAFNPLMQGLQYKEALRAVDGLHPNGEGYQQIANLISSWGAWQSILG